MVPQPPHQSVRRRETGRRRQMRDSYKSKAKFVRQEMGMLKEIVLEEVVWSKGLPHDVFCTILACLPLSSFFRLQCVCKKWSIISRDPVFVDAYTRISSQEASLFLASRDGTYWIYENGLSAWKRISSSFFCPKGAEGTWSPITAVGSRLLLTKNSGRDNDHDYSLMVYNPLNGTQQTLPPMLDEYPGNSHLYDLVSDIRVVGIFVDPSQSYYSVLVMDKKGGVMDSEDDSSDDEEDDLSLEYVVFHMQVYDSRTSNWDLNKIHDPMTGQLHLLNVASFGDGLRFLTIVRDSHRRRRHPIVADLAVRKLSTKYVYDGYDLNFETEAVPVSYARRDHALRVVTAHLFVTRGRPMLAAAVARQTKHKETLPKWKSIIIWELLEVGDRWVKWAEIKLRELDRSIFQVSLDTLFFLSEGDSLYFGSDTGKFLGIINISIKTWRLLPPFPGFLSHRRGPAAKTRRFLPPFPGFASHRGSFTDGGRPAADFATFVYKPGFDLVA